MRILLLTMYFAPDPAANSVIITELAEELLHLGHEVTVITTFPHYDTNRIWERYRGKLVERADHGQIRVHRTFLYVPQDKTKMIGRLLNYLSFNILSILVGFARTRHDIILAPSPPLTIGFVAYLLSRWHRIPYIYNVQDIYPDIAIRLGVLTNTHLVRFFRWLEHFVYRKAVAITVLSEGFRQNLLAKKVPDAKIHIIPNFVDHAFIRHLPKGNDFSRAHGLQGKFVVMYAGNVGLSQGLETVLNAAAILRDRDDIRFLIVGNGAAKSGLEKLATELELHGIIFLPFQSQVILPEMYATADVSLVCLRKGIGNESVPSKAYTIMASRRPILASVEMESETRRLIDEARCGLWIEPEDERQMANEVLHLYRDSQMRYELGKNGRAYIEEFHTPSVVARQYSKLIENIFGDCENRGAT